MVNDISWSSLKLRNDALIPLRGTFALAWEDEIIDRNPCDRIKNRPIQDTEPDPFSREEMERLLSNMRHRYATENTQLYWYAETAFWTGCRPSELIALQWTDVQLDSKTLIISKGRVKGIDQNHTKTKKVRTVFLNDRALTAFIELKAMGMSAEHVFISSETRQPWRTEKAVREALQLAMKTTGIRARPAYNARHTYATLLLMDGVNPTFVANQLGHSIVMLTKRYARWIHGEQSRAELAKLNTKRAKS